MPETSATAITEFLTEARTAGLGPEEIELELNARFGVVVPMALKRRIMDPRQVFEGGEGLPQVPPGMRPKTLTEEVIEPISGVAGIGLGALERGAEIMGRPIVESATGVKYPGRMPSEIEAAKEMGQIRKDIDREFTERRGEAATENIRRDLRENVEGILELVNVIRGTEDFIPQARSTMEHLWARGDEGKKVGRQFFTGLAADLTMMVDDPSVYVRARPVTSAMILAPHISHLNNLAKAGYKPALDWVNSTGGIAINRAVDSVAQQMRKTRTGAKAARKAQKTKLILQRSYDQARQLIGDSLLQPSERATRLTELLVDTANRTGMSAKQIGIRWAETVKRGIEDIAPGPSREMSPVPISTQEGVTFKVEKLKEAGIPEAKILELWDSTEGVKTLTNEYDYHPTEARVGPSKEAIRLTAEFPQWETKIAAEEARPTHITISRTNWKESVSRFVQQLDKIMDINPEQVMKTLNRKLSTKATGILISDILRETIIKNVTDKVLESGALSPDQLIRFKDGLSNFIIEMNKREPESTTYQRNALINIGGKDPIVSPTGVTTGFSDPVLQINLLDEILTAIDQNPKSARNIYSELIADAAIEIGAEAKINTVKRAAQEHIGTSRTNSEWIDGALKELADGHEPNPMIAHNPHQIATLLDQETQWYALKYGIPEQAIKELAYNIRKYKRVPVELVDAFGLTPFLDEIKTVKGKKTPEVFIKEVFAPEGVIESLTYERNAVQALKEGTGFWNWLNRQMKTNMTANNVASAINNITANFGYQTFRRADPLLLKDLTQMMAKYHGYRTGEHLRAGKGRIIKLSPEELRFFEAMERSGYLDTTALDIEMGGLGRDPGVLGVLGKPGKWLSQKQQKLYKGGDNIFKLEDAWYNTKKLNRDLADLENGRWIELEWGPRQKGKIWREYDGFVLEVPGKMRRRLSQTELDDIVTRASAKPGQDIFFDYTDVPNLIKWVRASKALGVTSPFFTWFWKAMDFPGKRGLISRLAHDGVVYNTNSPTLNTKIAGRNTLSSIKRSTVLAGIREAVTEPLNDETLRKVLAYSPKDFNLQLLNLTTNPMYIGHDSMESANQFGPSDIMIRLVQSGMADSPPTGLGPEGQRDFKNWMAAIYPEEEGKYGKMIDFDLSTITDPELKREIIIRRKLFKKHHAGEAFTAKDAATLVGISGNPIMETVQLISNADRVGQALDKRKLFQLGMMAAIGGTAARSIDIALGSHPAGRRISTRKWAENPIDGEQEQFIKWSIRRLTGIGFRPLDVGKRSKRYFKNKSKEWKISLTGLLREMLEDPEIDEIDRSNIQKRVVELERIVDGEMVLEQIHFDEVYKQIGEEIRKSK